MSKMICKRCGNECNTSGWLFATGNASKGLCNPCIYDEERRKKRVVSCKECGNTVILELYDRREGLCYNCYLQKEGTLCALCNKRFEPRLKRCPSCEVHYTDDCDKVEKIQKSHKLPPEWSYYSFSYCRGNYDRNHYVSFIPYEEWEQYMLIKKQFMDGKISEQEAKQQTEDYTEKLKRKAALINAEKKQQEDAYRKRREKENALWKMPNLQSFPK